jgi:DNA primase
MEALREYGSEADNAEITAKLRDIRLAEIHEQVMDELLNGPERRRKQEEEREYERNLMAQAQQRNTTAMQQNTTLLGRAQSQTIELQGSGGFASIPVGNGGTGASIARYPTSTDMENNGIMGALRKLI